MTQQAHFMAMGKSALKILLEKAMNFQDLLTLGSGFILDAEKAAATVFVGALHGKA